MTGMDLNDHGRTRQSQNLLMKLHSAPFFGCLSGAVANPAELFRYFVASLLALLVDIGLLLLLTQIFAIHYLAANVISFVSGSLVAYLASTNWVFETRRLDNRAQEYLIFILIGVIGLGVNEAAMWTCMEIVVWPLLAAKLVSAGISFFFNFALRKAVLFT